MNQPGNTNQLKLSKIKKFFFTIILIFLPFLILFFIEMVLRIVNYGDNLKLFIDFPGKEMQKYKIVNREKILPKTGIYKSLPRYVPERKANKWF